MELKPLALDVGCGPGYVMDILSRFMDVKGVDNDPDMVAMCRSRGLDVRTASAEYLPFEDGEFDVVYCSFLFLWLKDPVAVIKEMYRVSSKWVLCLAEPDFGARIDHPEELGRLKELVINGVKADGGDPFMGRKLRSIFQKCDLRTEMGIHPGVWDLEKLTIEAEDEWKWLEMTIGAGEGAEEMGKLKGILEEILKEGSLFQFNPIFYAIGRK